MNTTFVWIMTENAEERMMAEHAENRIISAAIFISLHISLEVCSFTDNEHYSNLESFLIQVNPK